MNAPANKPRPALVGPVSQAQAQVLKLETVGDLFNQPLVVQRLKEIAPRHLNPERMLRVLNHALRTTPELAKCRPQSLLGAVMTCTSVGLEPNTPLGHAYLVPFKKKVKRNGKFEEFYDVEVIFGYRGYIDLGYRGGQIKSWMAKAVFADDEFSYEYGTNGHLRHKPKGSSEKITHVYSYVDFGDGVGSYDVDTYERVLRTRLKSQGYQNALRSLKDSEQQGQEWKKKTYDATPWVANEEAMLLKTMVRRHVKFLPMSIEMQRVIEIEAQAEAGRGLDYASAVTFEGNFEGPAIDVEEDGSQSDGAGEQQQAGDGAAVKKLTPEAVAAGVAQWNKEHPDNPMEVDPDDPMNQRFVKQKGAAAKKTAAKPAQQKQAEPEPEAEAEAGEEDGPGQLAFA